ncbi:BC1872 family protein [Paenibacillus sp. B-A-8]|uniref:BC1872 family protein n=1 Tax=Paenibacillus sp. B-A-8 TaxID=3400419 RepID=UPI003B0184CA
MSRGEILAKWAELGARERDAWIATAVMGWRRVSRPGGGGGYIGWQDAEGRVVAIEEDSMTVDSRDYFRPSRDISAAWTVFERFPYIEIARIPGETTTYGVRINGLDGSILAMTQESTFPEAICLAALIAKLTEVSADV